MNVFISTFPFCKLNEKPINLLNKYNIKYRVNPLGRKLKESELCEFLGDIDILIAGTECISQKVLKHAPKLKLIARVGVGLDGVDLDAAKKAGIKVTYTPDAPAPAVAELAVASMLSLARSIHIANDQLHNGNWDRIFGRRLGDSTIGIIGFGRIGSRVNSLLQNFSPKQILACDPKFDVGSTVEGCLFVEPIKLLIDSDFITLHTPLTNTTRDLIGESELMHIKPSAFIINTARGGVINEAALFCSLKNNRIAGAAIDVFEQEPYTGPLTTLKNCLLTSHMGSMSHDCRSSMEIEATEEAVRFFRGLPLLCEVPDYEYSI